MEGVNVLRREEFPYLAKVGKNENFRARDCATYDPRRPAWCTGAHSIREGYYVFEFLVPVQNEKFISFKPRRLRKENEPGGPHMTEKSAYL